MSLLAIAFSLEADSDHRKPGLNSRAVFSDSSSDKNYESKGVMILKKGERMCQTRQLSIPVSSCPHHKSVELCLPTLANMVVLQGTIKDKLHGIPIDVSVDIQEAKRKRRQSAAPLTPVLDANEPSSHRAVVCTTVLLLPW